MSHPLRVLVVDDTVVYRRIVTTLLSDWPEVEVVGSAANGRIALQRTEQLAPDVLVLDLEMPDMDGLALLEELRRRGSDVGAIMLSAFTAQGAEATLAALRAGAFDFVPKPAGADLQENAEWLRRELHSKLAAYARWKSVNRILRGTAPGVGTKAQMPSLQQQASSLPAASPRPVAASIGSPEVVALGISTGGPQALVQMLPQLPKDFPVPMLIVQHMPPMFTRSLAEDLDRRCALEVCEAVDGQLIHAGQVWIAPGGRHMKVQREADQPILRITDDPPVNSCRPSVDYLFCSVAEVYGSRAVGVIMTGMGNDGAWGCQRLKACGASIIAQDEMSCVVFGMPREPIEKGLADVVVPLDRIAGEISRLAGRRGCLCR